MYREKSIKSQTCIKNYRQLKKAGNRRSGLLQGRAHPLLIQRQIVKHTIHIIQIEEVIFRNIYIKETINLKESEDRYVGGFGGREGRYVVIIV